MIHPSTRRPTKPLNHSPEALRWALRQAGLTQVALARQTGVSEGHMSEIVRGTRNARQPLLREIARALDCPVIALQAKQLEGEIVDA